LSAKERTVTSPTTRWIDDGVGLIDLHFQRRPTLIACYVLPTADGPALIEVGPGSTLETLLGGLRALGVEPQDIRHILVTHIHLDHAGAAGSLLQRLPDARLYVHERGARHMIDPSRLLASAGQVYGALMEPMWGEFLPCPADRVVAVTDGDRIEIGGMILDVLYTPGHASHHVAYHEPERHIVFAGDVAGVRVPPSPLVWPPTPPPDIDVEAWKLSTRRLRDLDPERLLIAHFGPWDNVWEHLDRLDERLDEWVGYIARWRAEGLGRDAMIDRLREITLAEIRSEPGSAGTIDATQYVTPFYMSVDGLVRYLDKRGG
jgi:glyoxylase-like metal-dependent hydrolase (beta-lactamase superfamily II)